jgi:hypothetical protein
MGDDNDAFMRNQNAAVRGTTKGQNRANVLQLKLVRFHTSYCFFLKKKNLILM